MLGLAHVSWCGEVPTRTQHAAERRSRQEHQRHTWVEALETLDDTATTARTNLYEHDWDAEIDVSRCGTDVHVSLIDDVAMSIEYGHITPDGSTVRGLHILRDAADL